MYEDLLLGKWFLYLVNESLYKNVVLDVRRSERIIDGFEVLCVRVLMIMYKLVLMVVFILREMRFIVDKYFLREIFGIYFFWGFLWIKLLNNFLNIICERYLDCMLVKWLLI